MKHTIITFALLFTSVLFAQSSNNDKNLKSQNISVTVSNASSDKGTISFALFNEKTFMKSEPLFSKSGKIKNGKSTVTFKNIVVGEYAIICFHDENNNKQMDFQQNGMPLESYGTSNNVINFGPPNFSDSKFEVKNEAIVLEIKF